MYHQSIMDKRPWFFLFLAYGPAMAIGQASTLEFLHATGTPALRAPSPKAVVGAPGNVGNGLVAFTKATASGQQVFTIAVDGTGERQLTLDGTSTFPAWSRDGTSIAFSSNRSGTSEIWIMDADGANQTQITFNTPGGNFIPEWSPDGTRIAYASQQNDVGHAEVWVMNADGTNQTRLTFTPPNPNGPTWSVHPSWSPDGQKLVYASTATGSTQIWMMNADGTNQVPITNGNGPQFPDSNASEWSRDGSTVAFWSGFETQFGEVWAMNPDGTNKRQLTETADPLNSDNPIWSPDGTKIIFDTNRAGPIELWVMNADGTNPTPLVATSGGPASWQPVLIPPGDPVPTVSQWGVIVTVLLLLVAGSVVLLRESVR
ncbi:MAG: TolB family protein [Phycisphaerae bacterium]